MGDRINKEDLAFCLFKMEILLLLFFFLKQILLFDLVLIGGLLTH